MSAFGTSECQPTPTHPPVNHRPQVCSTNTPACSASKSLTCSLRRRFWPTKRMFSQIWNAETVRAGSLHAAASTLLEGFFAFTPPLCHRLPTGVPPRGAPSPLASLGPALFYLRPPAAVAVPSASLISLPSAAPYPPAALSAVFSPAPLAPHPHLSQRSAVVVTEYRGLACGVTLGLLFASAIQNRRGRCC